MLTNDLTWPFIMASKSSMTGGRASKCREGGLAWSKARSVDGPRPDTDGAPSAASEGSAIVGTRSSRREVAASSLPSMVSASVAGRVEGIFGGKETFNRDGVVFWYIVKIWQE